MAITIDQASIGTPVSLASAASSIAITTNVAIAANALIVMAVFGDPPVATISSASGGSLTWTIDKQGAATTSGDVVAIISAPAVSGFSSGGLTVTVNYNASTTAGILGGLSLLGADLTGTRVDGTPLKNDLATAAWTSGSYTIAAGSVIVGASEIDQASSSTITSPSIEAWDKNEAVGGDALTQSYRIEAAGGSFAVAGTWGIAAANTTLAVAYKVASGGAAFMPRAEMVKLQAVNRAASY